MDINALLSPNEPSTPQPDGSSSSGSNSPTATRPRPAPGKRTSSGLSQELVRSPGRIRPVVSSPSSPYGSSTRIPTLQDHPMTAIPEATSAPRSTHQYAPTSHFPSPQDSPAGRIDPPQQPSHNLMRTSSTPKNKSLPEAALRQSRVHLKQTNSAGAVRVAGTNDSFPSPSAVPPSLIAPPISRTSSSQSLADLTMAEAPAQTPPPRSFTSLELSEEDSRTVTELLSYLADNPYAYGHHVELINILHKGFLTHMYPHDTTSRPSQNPQGYSLLKELRQAREAMDSRFAVGEDIWSKWLADEALLARSSEDRLAVTELFQKATQDEPISVKIWTAYADWVEINHAACNSSEMLTRSGWTEEDKAICRDLFTTDMLMNVLEEGANATQWRVDESQVTWQRLAKFKQRAAEASPDPSELVKLREWFQQRVLVPHVQSSETVQLIWDLVSKHDQNHWEAIMAAVNEAAEPAKAQMSLRVPYEAALQDAVESRNQEAIFSAFASYLDWEENQPTKKRYASSFEMRCALFERALLRFPTHKEWWLDYVDFITVNSPSLPVHALLERATRHCPWSGDLWGSRILRLDVEGRPYAEIDATKHRATNSVLLEVGGMEELLKVLQQWCSYLRRLAFRTESSEDDLDTAEIGITMALEDIQQAGARIYGASFKGDPLYRLERIQIKFLSQGRRFTEVRDIYRRLSKVHKDSADFWLRYYNWELWVWGYERLSEPRRVETRENGPHLATRVLQEAFKQKKLDWPDRVLDMYWDHFQQHESGENLQGAIIEAREFSKKLAIRRAREAEEAAEQAEQVVSEQVAMTQVLASGEKRKAEESTFDDANHKKARLYEEPTDQVEGEEAPISTNANSKRDREHNTITLRNLPIDVAELDIKKFFREIGQPKSINIKRDESQEISAASVEFESHDDIPAAKTRNGKKLNGHEVRISSGSQNTLYVTNYPPEYDEDSIRGLFDSYGEILSVRFPSLKFNSRRRFCYVTFVDEEMSQSAEHAMDGKMLDGRHKLVAKISNPDAKSARSGPQAEGREILVKNINFVTPEEQIKDFFTQYGQVVSINLLKLVNNKRTGTGFVVFATAEEASRALEANHKPLDGRVLHVELSHSRGGTAPSQKAVRTDVIVRSAPSASPGVEGDNEMASPESSATKPNGQKHADGDSAQTARERKAAILHLPDTVNDARIRAAMEAYGTVVKIQLRRQNDGAIIEFVDVQSAFNVRQGVDCTSLGPDVRTGDVADLLATKSNTKRTDGVVAPPPPSSSSSSSSSTMLSNMRPPLILRPAQARGGRRGGLGMKRGVGLGFSAARGENQEGATKDSSSTFASAPTTDATTKDGAKSNADFRALLEQSRQREEPAPLGEGES